AWQSFPFLVVILSIMAVLGPGLSNIVLALGVVGAANASRVIRGTTTSVVENVYVESARAIGCGHLRLMVRHILPNVAGTIIVLRPGAVEGDLSRTRHLAGRLRLQHAGRCAARRARPPASRCWGPYALGDAHLASPLQPQRGGAAAVVERRVRSVVLHVRLPG